MTPLEARVLDAVLARPGRSAHEIADEVQRDARGIESALRILERGRFVTCGDARGVVVWSATPDASVLATAWRLADHAGRWVVWSGQRYWLEPGECLQEEIDAALAGFQPGRPRGDGEEG